MESDCTLSMIRPDAEHRCVEFVNESRVTVHVVLCVHGPRQNLSLLTTDTSAETIIQPNYIVNELWTEASGVARAYAWFGCSWPFEPPLHIDVITLHFVISLSASLRVPTRSSVIAERRLCVCCCYRTTVCLFVVSLQYNTSSAVFYYSAKAGGVKWSFVLSFVLSVSRVTHKRVIGRRPNMVGIGKGWHSGSD